MRKVRQMEYRMRVHRAETQVASDKQFKVSLPSAGRCNFYSPLATIEPPRMQLCLPCWNVSSASSSTARHGLVNGHSSMKVIYQVAGLIPCITTYMHMMARGLLTHSLVVGPFPGMMALLPRTPDMW